MSADCGTPLSGSNRHMTMYDSHTSTVGQYRTYPLGFTHNRSCGSRSPPCQPHLYTAVYAKRQAAARFAL